MTELDFNYDTQHLFASMLIANPSLFARVMPILRPEYFHDRLKKVITFAFEYYEEYHSVPTIEIVNATCAVSLLDTKADAYTGDWFFDTIETFCRHRAMEQVIFDASDLVEKRNYTDIETKLKEALTIKLSSDMGTDLFADPTTRLKDLLDRKNVVSTGWASIDKLLYGGFQKGALNIFAAQSGMGKSLYLQNLAVNWAKMGKDVVYITLELSESLVSSRLDAIVTGMSTKEIFKEVERVAAVEKSLSHKFGKLIIKKMPEVGTTCNDIRAYIKEYIVKYGKAPDAVLIDYMDLMYPNNKRIDVGNLFIKDKFVSEEMRALYSEFDCIGATASQLNRSAVDAAGEFDHGHIAGGMSKINTADNVFSVYSSMAMRERGEFSVKCLKIRSSSATGKTITMAFDVDNLRIADMPSTEDSYTTTQSNSAPKLSEHTRPNASAEPAPWDEGTSMKLESEADKIIASATIHAKPQQRDNAALLSRLGAAKKK